MLPESVVRVLDATAATAYVPVAPPTGVKAAVVPVMTMRAPLAAAEYPTNSAVSVSGMSLRSLIDWASLPAIRASAAALPSTRSAASTKYEAVCTPIVKDQVWPAAGVPDRVTVRSQT